MIDRLKDLDAFLLRRDDAVRDAMERLSGGRLRYQFVIVIESDGRLIGTVSDGDIRRALLAGISLRRLRRRVRHQSPIVGHVDLGEANIGRLQRIAAQTAFLPILNAEGRLHEVLVQAVGRSAECRALIMAGGFGTRLGERTRATPKSLLSVAGKPILEHILERLEAAQISDIFVLGPSPRRPDRRLSRQPG